MNLEGDKLIFGPWLFACASGNLDVVIDKLHIGKNYITLNNGLLAASRYGQTKIVEYLIYTNIDLDILNKNMSNKIGSPCFHAFHNGYIDIIVLFLKRYTIDEIFNNYMFYIESTPMNTTIIKKLKDNKYKLDINLINIYSVRIQNIKLLLSIGFDINSRVYVSLTAGSLNCIDYGIVCDYYEKVMLLIENGGKPTKKVRIFEFKCIEDRRNACIKSIIYFLTSQKIYFKFIQKDIFVRIIKLVWEDRFKSMWDK